MIRITGKKYFPFLTPALLLVFLLPSCRTLKIESPPESYQQEVSVPVFSDITIPVEVEIRKIEKMLNEQYRDIIYQDTSYLNNGGDDLKIIARKAGNFALFMEGSEISYRIPLSLWIKKRTRIGAFGYHYTDEREITGSIALNFRTRMTVRKDWTISTLTTSNGYEWLKQPSVRLGPVEFPLGFIADLLISANQTIINRDIDRTLSSVLDIRQMMTEVWKTLQVPFRIEGDYPLWVKIVPTQVRMVSPQAENGKLRLAFGIHSVTEMFYNETAPQYKISNTLPEILFTSKLDDQFTINLMSEVPFTHINEIAAKQMKGYTLRQGKYTVSVENISLYGNGSNLVVATGLSGSVNGTVYLVGKPYYDRQSKSLKIADLDFDLKTKNVLVKSAGWLFHNGLLETLQSKLEFPVGDQLESARQQIQDLLNQNPKLEMFRISGRISRIDISSILITPEAVKGMFEFEGNVRVDLE